MAATTAVERALSGTSHAGAVYFLGPDEKVVSQATFTTPKTPLVGNAESIMPPDAVYADGQIFYVDENGQVRSLDRDGAIKDIIQFPLTSRQAFLSFWVDPTGTKLAAVVIKVPDLQPRPSDSLCAGGEGPGSGPLHTTVYFGNAGGTPRQVASSDVANQNFEATRLVGWGPGGPIAALNAPVGTQDGQPGIDFSYEEFAYLNSDGSVGQAVGGTGCGPWAATSDGVLCAPGAGNNAPTSFVYRDFSGTQITSFSLPGG